MIDLSYRFIEEYFKTLSTVYESSYNIFRNLNPWDRLSEEEKEEFLRALVEVFYDGIEFSNELLKDFQALAYEVDPEEWAKVYQKWLSFIEKEYRKLTETMYIAAIFNSLDDLYLLSTANVQKFMDGLLHYYGFATKLDVTRLGKAYVDLKQDLKRETRKIKSGINEIKNEIEKLKEEMRKEKRGGKR
ncbi:hypothetical protein DRO97_10040 [Archaeoglobales archaeon]|nr:MAG: hypothetical protein DRO97_10040 [Archaeoglobales archaeon]